MRCQMGEGRVFSVGFRTSGLVGDSAVWSYHEIALVNLTVGQFPWHQKVVDISSFFRKYW